MRKNPHPSRWTLPAMEHMKINEQYAFSYNPESQPGSYSSDRIPKWWTEQIKLFGCLKASTVEIAVEISKLGRLHFHGTIQISSLWKFYYYDVPKLMGNGSFEIDTISKHDEWMAYVNKNKEEMSEMMESFALPRTLATKRVKIQNTKPDVKRFFTEEPLTPINSDTDTDTDTSSLSSHS